MNADRLVADIDAAVQALPERNTAAVRAVRRHYSRALKSAPPALVLAVAHGLQARDDYRWIGYELVRYHKGAFQRLDATELAALGQGIDSWQTVDAFGRTLSGPVWLAGRIPDALVGRWAESPDRWWRRAALVSTVALNAKTDGGTGDVSRTLAICRQLVDDRDDMVVKALSWALRELVPWDAAAVEQFLREHETRLAARVKREVRNKIETGLKNPR